VSESKTEAERLRAQARRAFELARASMIRRLLSASRPMPLNFWKGQMPSTSKRARTEVAAFRLRNQMALAALG
jgi:hypothetical protein